MATIFERRCPSPLMLSPACPNDTGDSIPVSSLSSSAPVNDTSHSSLSTPERQPDYYMTRHSSPHTLPPPSLSPWSSGPDTPPFLLSSPRCSHLIPPPPPATSPSYSRPDTASPSPVLPPVNEVPLSENASLELKFPPLSPSFASFASDRDEYTSDSEDDKDSDNERISPSSELSDLERELLQIRSPPHLEKARTSLPSFRPQCSSSVSSSASRGSSRAHSSSSSYRVAKRGSRWSTEDSVMLRHLREERRLQWVEVSKLMPGRTVLACNRYYNKTKLAASLAAGMSSSDGAAVESTTTKKAKMHRWKPEEIQKLRKLKAAGASWKIVAEQMPGRTIGACRRKKELTKREVKANSLASLGDASEDVGVQNGAKVERHDVNDEAEEHYDREMSDVELVEEGGPRSISETETLSVSLNPGNDDRPDIDIEERELEDRGESDETEALESAILDADEVVESCRVDASASSSGNDSSSESESEFEDEARKRRMHETFFKNR